MMTGHLDSSAPEQLREEAARWFAAMRGPDADAQRVAFETWLASDPAHRRAYNDISETFHLGRALRAHRSINSDDTLWRWLALAAMIGLAIAALFGFGQLLDRELHSPVQTAARTQARPTGEWYRTRTGEIRTVLLLDHSKATLDTDTRLAVVYDREQRVLRLEAGRARFDVMHEPRPFTVIAGTTSITAHGTVFDVVRASGSAVRVHLLRGSIDVRPAGTNLGPPSERRITRMRAGDDLVFNAATKPEVAPAGAGNDQWPDGIEQYSDAPLATLIADAARYNRKPIILGDPVVANLRVSGTFRLQDSHRLAGNLASLFGLAVKENGQSIILSTRCDNIFSESCPPPS